MWIHNLPILFLDSSISDDYVIWNPDPDPTVHMYVKKQDPEIKKIKTCIKILHLLAF